VSLEFELEQLRPAIDYHYLYLAEDDSDRGVSTTPRETTLVLGNND
jgi:hypothetical protein